MAMPKVLDWLDELVAKVATNTANIAQNTSDIAANKALFDTHVADDERHWTTEDRQNFDRVVHFKGYYTSIEKLQEAYPTGQLGDYAIVGGTDTVWLWDDESNSWLNSTEQGIVISVNGRTGEVVLTKTDVGLSNVDNTADKDKPVSTAQQTALNSKADRKKITLAQAESLALRAGIYYIDNEQKTIKDFASNYWTIIVAERSAGTNNASATQIWMNYNSNVTQHIYMRKQQSGTSWSEFREIMTDIHYSELDTKIQENTENITQNTTDIETLNDNKVDRKIITLEEAEGFSLRSGIYYINNESYTIHQTKSQFWTVIIGESNLQKSVSQIWIPVVSQIPVSMFLRHQVNTSTSWTDFVEILTTDIATREDIARFKQYKGYYALLSDLRSAFPTATDGDYAIVGSALYIWNSRTSSWTEVSGSGGSTGTGKWSIRQYDTPDYTSQFIPQFKDIVGKTLDKQWEIEDTTDYFFNQDSVSNKCFLFETYVNMEEETSFSSTTLVHDDGINVYVNGISTYSQKATSASSQQTSLTINLKQGWNKIQILLCEVSGGEGFRLGIKFTDNAKCLGMDCYHAETEPILGYVPLVGDSTIEGNITIEGTVGVTSNSYLQYNASDDSLSFMFNN